VDLNKGVTPPVRPLGRCGAQSHPAGHPENVRDALGKSRRPVCGRAPERAAPLGKREGRKPKEGKAHVGNENQNKRRGWAGALRGGRWAGEWPESDQRGGWLQKQKESRVSDPKGG